MTELRRRMNDDMLARGFADRTRESYVWAVTGLARFYKRSPDQIADAEIQAYVVHLLRDRQLSWSTCNIVACSPIGSGAPSSPVRSISWTRHPRPRPPTGRARWTSTPRGVPSAARAIGRSRSCSRSRHGSPRSQLIRREGIMMMTTGGLSTSSTHVVTHARMPLCLDREARLRSDSRDLLSAALPAGCRASVRCARLQRLAQSQRHASLPALQSP